MLYKKIIKIYNFFLEKVWLGNGKVLILHSQILKDPLYGGERREDRDHWKEDRQNTNLK